MDIEKAIEILKELHRMSHDGKDPDWRGAIKLGIEALKFRQYWEELQGDRIFSMLPGETKE